MAIYNLNERCLKFSLEECKTLIFALIFAMQGVTHKNPEVLLTKISGSLLDKFNNTSESFRQETYNRLLRYPGLILGQPQENVFRFFKILEE